MNWSKSWIELKSFSSGMCFLARQYPWHITDQCILKRWTYKFEPHPKMPFLLPAQEGGVMFTNILRSTSANLICPMSRESILPFLVSDSNFRPAVLLRLLFPICNAVHSLFLSHSVLAPPGLSRFLLWSSLRTKCEFFRGTTCNMLKSTVQGIPK